MAGVACVAWSFSNMENHSSASALALLGCLESWNVGMLECWNAVKVLWRIANSCTMQCQLDAKTRSVDVMVAMSQCQHIFAPSFFFKKYSYSYLLLPLAY